MREEDEVVFPDSRGELNKIVASSGIKETSNELRDVLSRGSKRTPYLKATPEMKAVASWQVSYVNHAVIH